MSCFGKRYLWTVVLGASILGAGTAAMAQSVTPQQRALYATGQAGLNAEYAIGRAGLNAEYSIGRAGLNAEAAQAAAQQRIRIDGLRAANQWRPQPVPWRNLISRGAPRNTGAITR
jgi:hypothetical protein